MTLLAWLALFTGNSYAQSTRPIKKLIEFGWDEPDTTYLRAHIAEMEKTPFDGTVFSSPGRFPVASRGESDRSPRRT
jgi:hypothetical protein